MSELPLPEWHDVDAALAPLSLATTPAELHGALSGWLAGGGELDGRWLANVLADPNLPEADASALTTLRDATRASMEDQALGFELLLPEESASLGERSQALFDWCRSFLGAFGLAVGADPTLSEEGQEALQDLAKLATAEAQDDGDEEDEEAFVEIVEFVRVAALLLHGDCALGPRHRKRLH